MFSSTLTKKTDRSDALRGAKSWTRPSTKIKCSNPLEAGPDKNGKIEHKKYCLRPKSIENAAKSSLELVKRELRSAGLFRLLRRCRQSYFTVTNLVTNDLNEIRVRFSEKGFRQAEKLATQIARTFGKTSKAEVSKDPS